MSITVATDFEPPNGYSLFNAPNRGQYSYEEIDVGVSYDFSFEPSSVLEIPLLRMPGLLLI